VFALSFGPGPGYLLVQFSGVFYRLTQLESVIEAQIILFLKRYANNENRSWKYILDSCLRNVGGSFLLKCNFDVCSLPVTLPCFYTECLKSWTTLMEGDNETLNGVEQ